MMILALVLLVTAIAVVLARTISSDGYGTRPIPPSHHDDLPTHRLR
jgi:hypothetical protein|nr:hypothetical protein [Aeromicrobium sp.]